MMAISPLAGKPAPKELLVDLARLEREYYERRPDMGDPNQVVSFGTSGHRGTPLSGTFTEAHIWPSPRPSAIIRNQGTDGPLHGQDTHASVCAATHGPEVLAGNGVETIIQPRRRRRRLSSRAPSLVYNRGAVLPSPGRGGG